MDDIQTLLFVLQILSLLVGAWLIAFHTSGRRLFGEMKSAPLTWQLAVGLALAMLGGMGVTSSIVESLQWDLWKGLLAYLAICLLVYIPLRLIAINRHRDSV